MCINHRQLAILGIGWTKKSHVFLQHEFKKNDQITENAVYKTNKQSNNNNLQYVTYKKEKKLGNIHTDIDRYSCYTKSIVSATICILFYI